MYFFLMTILMIVIDMLINLNTTYYYNGKYITNKYNMFINYCKTSLMLDVLIIYGIITIMYKNDAQ